MKKKRVFLLMTVIITALFIGSCNGDQKSWENAKTKNDKEGYLSIIVEYPKSEYADSAFVILKKMVQSENDVESAVNYFESIKSSVSSKRFQDSISTHLKNLYEIRPLFIILKEGKIGFINNKGEIIIQPQFTSGFDFESGTTLIQQDSLWGFIDKKGEIIVKPQYLEVSGFSEGLAAVKQNDKWGYIDTSGTFVVPPKYSDAWPFSGQLALVELDDKWGFIDKAGKPVIDFTYKGAYYKGNVSINLQVNDTAGIIYIPELGLSFIANGAKFGYKDFNNVTIVKKKYEWLQLSNYFGFGNSSGFGYTDKKEPNSVTFSDIECPDVFDGDLALLFKNGKWGFMDKNGNPVVTPQYKNISRYFENLAIVETSTGLGFINKKGEIIIKPIYTGAKPFDNGLATIRQGEKWGYIDQLGNIVIKPQFEDCYNFIDDMALIKVKNKYGYINKKGETIIEPTYVDANNFSEDMASVKIDMKWGFIDRSGKLVIQAQFDEVDNFKNGLARVKIDKQIGYIDTKGNLVWKPAK